MKRLRFSSMCAFILLMIALLPSFSLFTASAANDNVAAVIVNTSADPGPEWKGWNAPQGYEVFEGKPCISTAGEGFMISKVLDAPINTTGLNFHNAGLRLSIYFDNVDDFKMDNAFIEVSPRGKPDLEEHCWSLYDLAKTGTIKAGQWNDIVLPFASAFVEGKSMKGLPDINKTNFFRIYAHFNDPARTVSMKVSDVRVVKLDDYILSTCDWRLGLNAQDSGWVEDVPFLSFRNKTDISGIAVKSGNGYVGNADVTGGYYELNFPKSDYGFTMKNGRLNLMLYLSNPTAIEEGFIRLKDGANSFSWKIKDYATKKGWNEISLPVATAAKEGNPDINKMTNFRLEYNYSGTATGTLLMDYIKLSKGADTNVVNPVPTKTPTAGNNGEPTVTSGTSEGNTTETETDLTNGEETTTRETEAGITASASTAKPKDGGKVSYVWLIVIIIVGAVLVGGGVCAFIFREKLVGLINKIRGK